VPEVRIFNPAYTPRSYFAGDRGRKENNTVAHQKRHNRRYHHRHNPLGLQGGVIRDAVYNAGGALASVFIASLLGGTGWAGVAYTAGGAIAASFGARMALGAPAAEEVLKGGLSLAVVKALAQAGVIKASSLGLYAPSYFAVPTASNQYGVSYAPGMSANRGAGTVYFPGPGQPMLMPPSNGGNGGMGRLGYHRFRSRYAGNYGGAV
jgi:hypothetical protein